jgi:hypothetical protein
MDPQDKLKVKQDPEGAVKNTQFLQLIARKTNIAVDTVRQGYCSTTQQSQLPFVFTHGGIALGRMPCTPLAT